MRPMKTGIGLIAVLVLGILLTGCGLSLISTSESDLNRVEREEALGQLSLLSSQQVSLRPYSSGSAAVLIKPGETVSGYLDGYRYSDYDWHRLEGVTRGTRITLTLSGPAQTDFDLWLWKDGKWETNWNFTSDERLETVAGRNNWIFVGAWRGKGEYQLKVTATTPEGDISAYGAAIVSEAETWVRLGVRYEFGGESKNGVDCSGLVRQVYMRATDGCAFYEDRSARQIKERAIPIATPSLGDVIVFEPKDPEKRKGPWHVGIYIGTYYIGVDGITDIYFIHADGSDHVKKVVYERLRYCIHHRKGFWEDNFWIHFVRYNPDEWRCSPPAEAEQPLSH